MASGKPARENLYKQLEKITHVEYNQSLSKYTTIGIGGPAEAFVTVKTRDDFINVINTAKKTDVPIFILGLGANVIVSDLGFEGLVIKNEYKDLEILGTKLDKNEDLEYEKLVHNIRHEDLRLSKSHEGTDVKYLNFTNLDYDDITKETTEIVVGSGYVMQQLISETLNHGLTGLQWFSGIPATLGGAVYNNIHGGNRQIDNFFVSAEVIINGKTSTLELKDMKFDYDYSVLHETNYPVVSVKLRLFHHDVQKARETSIAWVRQKVVQPKKSPGCFLRNFTEEEVKKYNLPSNSASYVLDRVLNVHGMAVNDAMIAPSHANFITNKGNATAKDVVLLINQIKEKAKKQIGIDLREEFFYIGNFNYVNEKS